MPSKRDKSDPKESDEDSGVTTDEDDDKPQNGNKSPDYDPDPYVFPASTYKLKKEFDKALQVRKRILNDKSLSEEVRTVHLHKRKLLIEDMTREIVAGDAALSAETTAEETHRAKIARGEEAFERVRANLKEKGEWAPPRAAPSDEDAYLECIAKAKAIQERITARENAAKTQASSSNTDEDWTFDRLGVEPVLEQPAVRRTADVAADKEQWVGFLASTVLQSAAPASARVRKRNSSPQHIRESSPGKGARPSSPTEVADPNQDRDMRAEESSSAVAEDLSKSDGESESPSEEFDENLFLENLDKLAASGDLDTVEGVKQALINAFGEEMIVSGGLVFNLIHKLLQRTDPFNRLVKNYEDKQGEMMRAQRNFVKDEIAYLHRKMREQLTKDSTVLAKVMQETHDKREVELKQLRAENKKSAIDLALHVSDFQLYKLKYAAPSGADELAQCQKDLQDTQIRSLQKDDEIQALDLHIHMLKGLMHIHGMEIPSDDSKSASAPNPAPTAENVPTWGNSNAPPIVDLNNNGWGTNPAPSPALTQESYHQYSDESMDTPHGKYGKNSYHKGYKGKGQKGSGSKSRNSSHSQGKRGRDTYEEDKREREVKQKTWNADGKITAENWSKSI
jgi:hypothetical protein